MSELLAPVGSINAFYAAIANGCDAIYLGLNKHNARAYADNFSIDNLKEYIDYAHLRNVKIYVTLNTIIYDNELNEIYETIDKLAALNVDAIIVQDLAVLHYALNKYKSLEVHASTQMGIDDFFGAKLLKELGVKRIVLARETPIEIIKQIKNNLNIEIETFIHGALCVSYSGNCFMSASIGERSGNRGRCAGCCRKLYTLIDIENKTKIKTGYLLSMKDLNLSNHISNMKYIDSFKIEGRMKDASYVAKVTNIYRNILDNENVNLNDLNKVFNRTYTKGFIFNESSENITNINRPNNTGYPIGKIAKIYDKKIWIKLFDELNKGDLLLMESNTPFEDVTINVTKIFDANFKVVESSKSTIILYTDKDVKLNSTVYKIKDNNFNKLIENELKNKEYKKLPLNATISIKRNEPILLKLNYQNNIIYQKSSYIVTDSVSSPITSIDIEHNLSKLNDTPYYLDNIQIDLDENVFVPVKVLNELRREAIIKLNNSRLNKKIILNKKAINITPLKHNINKPTLTVEVSTLEQYEFVKPLGIKNIYFKNIVRRNNSKYIDEYDEILIGGLGSLEYYKNKNVKLISDYSFNVNNHVSAGLLSSLGINRITLSNELNEGQINNLIYNYKKEYNVDPNFELIVYGRSYIMHSKYCPLKRLNLCGECHKHKYALKDDFESFPIRFNEDCTINLLNAKTLNLIDEISNIKNINYFRLVFTNETIEEIENIINAAKNNLNSDIKIYTFNGKIHTRGNFRKKLL